FTHEEVIAKLFLKMGTFAQERGLGTVLGSDLLYILPSGNRRGPDISFIAASRITAETRARPFPRMAPDLAVEIVSPDDRARRVLDKVGEYLESGVRLVWVIDPQKRRALAYRSLTEASEISASGALEGGDVLPGFLCPLADLLP